MYNLYRVMILGMVMTQPPLKITGVNAVGPLQLPMRTRWIARVGQFWHCAAMRRSIPVVLALLPTLCGCGRRFRQDSSSMSPTIRKGEIVYLDTSAYASATPKRWDVIVFTHPENQTLWCARVVGLPGEIISIDSNGISIGGSRQSQPDAIKAIQYVPSVPGISAVIHYPYTVSAGSYFVLGDNTTNAYDSRFWGTVPVSNIRGRVRDK